MSKIHQIQFWGPSCTYKTLKHNDVETQEHAALSMLYHKDFFTLDTFKQLIQLYPPDSILTKRQNLDWKHFRPLLEKQDGRHGRFFSVMKSAYISLIGPRGLQCETDL